MVLGVSVIICTYNGAERIPETLRHLALQQVPVYIPWEIIIVNNASKDATMVIAKKEWQKYQMLDVEVKFVEQPFAGLSHAREKGILTANYEYLLFCDDDNWLFPEYVSTAFNIINSDPKIGVLGGCGIFEPEQPDNKEIEKFKEYYVNGSQQWTSTQHWVYGAGSLYKKSILIELLGKGWQQITTGRIGSKLISGEDVEICFMIYLSGYKIISDDRLIFKHFVPLKRQSIAFIISMVFWLNYSNTLLICYYALIHNDKRPIKKILDDRFWDISKTLIKQYILYCYKSIKSWGKYTTEQKIAFQSTRGKFFSLLQNRKTIIVHYQQISKILSSNF